MLITPDTELQRTLKASFAGAKDYRPNFASSLAQLTISVGQSVHEGERLAATLALINRSFASCKVMIDDSIQWYTLAIGSKDKKARLLERAIAAGDHYLQTHLPLFAAYLTIPYEMIRWKDWIATPAWKAAIEKMEQCYEADALLRAAIHQNVATFLARYEERGVDSAYDRSSAWQLCVAYLLEECAVMQSFWVDLGCHYEVYPSGRNEAMTATYERYIQPFHPHLLKPVALRFHRRGSRKE